MSVERNQEGQFEVAVGTRVLLKGKHAIATATEHVVGDPRPCCDCVLHGSPYICRKLACCRVEREDDKEIYFKEIKK